jgi:hypothetical protein
MHRARSYGHDLAAPVVHKGPLYRFDEVGHGQKVGFDALPLNIAQTISRVCIGRPAARMTSMADRNNLPCLNQGFGFRR